MSAADWGIPTPQQGDQVTPLRIPFQKQGDAIAAALDKLRAMTVSQAANAAERDALFPSPKQGDRVFRLDLGYTEQYWQTYNATTNPNGADISGWGPQILKRILVFGASYNNMPSSAGVLRALNTYALSNTQSNAGNIPGASQNYQAFASIDSTNGITLRPGMYVGAARMELGVAATGRSLIIPRVGGIEIGRGVFSNGEDAVSVPLAINVPENSTAVLTFAAMKDSGGQASNVKMTATLSKTA